MKLRIKLRIENMKVFSENAYYTIDIDLILIFGSGAGLLIEIIKQVILCLAIQPCYNSVDLSSNVALPLFCYY